MKKKYLKPDAEYIAFYSNEEIAKVLPLENHLEGDKPTGENGSELGDPDWT